MFGSFITSCGAACGQFRFSPHAQGAAGAFPGKRPVMGAARPRNPQHFHRVRTGSAPLCTGHPHACAQTAGKQSSYPQRAAPCVPGQAHPDARLQARGQMRSPERAGIRMPGIGRGPRRPRYAQAAPAALVTSSLLCRSRKLKVDTLVPSSGFQQLIVGQQRQNQARPLHV
jgi:hypothetical protein